MVRHAPRPTLFPYTTLFRSTQERLSDPSVYNDHREAAEVGRRLKELEGPFKLAERWREASEDAQAARSDPELRELVRSEEHTSELQSRRDLVCRLLLEKKNR